jgi:hypothetical protein
MFAVRRGRVVTHLSAPFCLVTDPARLRRGQGAGQFVGDVNVKFQNAPRGLQADVQSGNVKAPPPRIEQPMPLVN